MQIIKALNWNVKCCKLYQGHLNLVGGSDVKSGVGWSRIVGSGLFNIYVKNTNIDLNMVYVVLSIRTDVMLAWFKFVRATKKSHT